MPLLDHFRPPLVTMRSGESFHHAWAAQIAGGLNEQLPDGYFAEAHVRFGVEVDVGTLDGHDGEPFAGWSPPTATLTVPLTFTDAVEVIVFGTASGPELLGAVELVSPANKDRPDTRAALVGKCATLLRAGIGLAVVDVVTTRRANLHRLLLDELSPDLDLDFDAELYAASYRPGRRGEATEAEVWHEPLTLGAPLPELPLWLRHGPCLRLGLNAAYEQVCRMYKLSA